MISKRFCLDAFVWGAILWFIGYLLGIALFFILPTAVIGWLIMPVGILITLWVLVMKIKSESFIYYLILAIVWTAIAVILDYFFLVKVFNPADGYYKLDVYLYYAFTFSLPLIVGFWITKANKKLLY